MAPTELATVKGYPPLLAAAIKAGKAPAARVNVLLKARDRDGRGMVDVAEVRELLTAKDSDWRICGRRRLRGILAEGAGTFWHREVDKKRGIDRLWLFRPARIAEALGCGRLRGMPAAMPVEALLDGLTATKAAFLAS
jgi:hypothetical protein